MQNVSIDAIICMWFTYRLSLPAHMNTLPHTQVEWIQSIDIQEIIMVIHKCRGLNNQSVGVRHIKVHTYDFSIIRIGQVLPTLAAVFSIRMHYCCQASPFEHPNPISRLIKHSIQI